MRYRNFRTPVTGGKRNRLEPIGSERGSLTLNPVEGVLDLHEVFELAEATLDHWRALGADCAVLGLTRCRLLSWSEVDPLFSRLKIEDCYDRSILEYESLTQVVKPVFNRLAGGPPVWLLVGRIQDRPLVVGVIENTPELDDFWREQLDRMRWESH
ncbi:MAG: hypothetical protein AB1641_02030 [Thermodesulfobacteriota bacterium]